MSIELEICIACDTLEAALHNARAAAEGGADRLECCADMTMGGLTPDPRIIEAIRKAVAPAVSVLVMVRPRDGDFEWSDAESIRMKDSIQEMATTGADGIVSGGLRQGRIDRKLTAELISHTHAAGMQFTFHRAIDAAQDRRTALADLTELGCDRVLTSGTSWESGLGALDGTQALNETARLLGGSAELVIGGGISSETISQLLPSIQSEHPVSYHAYSSVLEGGLAHADRVRELRTLLDKA